MKKWPPEWKRSYRHNRLYIAKQTDEIDEFRILEIRSSLALNTKPVIAITGRKGGIGKSTLTANLAAEFVILGRPDIALDADPQQSLSTPGPSA